jgi:hypothetical protein
MSNSYRGSPVPNYQSKCHKLELGKKHKCLAIKPDIETPHNSRLTGPDPCLNHSHPQHIPKQRNKKRTKGEKGLVADAFGDADITKQKASSSPILRQPQPKMPTQRLHTPTFQRPQINRPESTQSNTAACIHF